MMKRLSWVVIGVFLTISFLSTGAAADQAIQWFANYQTGSVQSNQTIGWSFTVTQPIMVTYLGVWDERGDGLGQAHDVAIWNDVGVDRPPGPAPIVSATVPVGTSGWGTPAPGGLWRWVALPSPVWLAPGNYRIGGYYLQSSDPYAFGDNTMVVNTGPGVAYGQAYSEPNGAGLEYPWFAPGQRGWFGPNFKYVPEPALLQLPFLMGLGGVGLWLRRRKTA